LTGDQDCANKKGCIVKEMIVAFTMRQWKWHMLFDLVREIESTGLAIVVIWSELIQKSSRFIT